MKHWSHDDLRDFRALYPRSTDVDLALRFELSLAEVETEAARWALGKDKATFGEVKMQRWSDEDVAVLTALYETHANVEIARVLERSVTSVLLKGTRLGLKKSALRRAIAGSENVRARRTNPPMQDDEPSV